MLKTADHPFESLIIRVALQTRLDATVLDGPHTLGVEEAELRDVDSAPVDELGIAGQTDQSAPGSRTDDLPKAALAEVVRKGIATG